MAACHRSPCHLKILTLQRTETTSPALPWGLHTKTSRPQQKGRQRRQPGLNAWRVIELTAPSAFTSLFSGKKQIHPVRTDSHFCEIFSSPLQSLLLPGLPGRLKPPGSSTDKSALPSAVQAVFPGRTTNEHWVTWYATGQHGIVQHASCRRNGLAHRKPAGGKREPCRLWGPPGRLQPWRLSSKLNYRDSRENEHATVTEPRKAAP